jgi:K+-transporting ATPase ATPase C chain
MAHAPTEMPNVRPEPSGQQPPNAIETSAEPAKREPWRQSVLGQLRPAIVLLLLMTAITGIIYPVVTTGIAQAIFPSQANGSLVTVNGKPVASRLIGQYWTQPQYFQGRPSATVNASGAPAPYNAASSAGSNLGPTNKVLITTVQQRIAALKKDNPDVPAGTPIPPDLVEASASGLDPDISIAAAYYQIPRVAKARHLAPARLRQIINSHIHGRFLGLFGEPYVNVLELNMALDGIAGH